MIKLNWNDIEKLIKKITNEIDIKKISYDCIVGVSRSGLIPAVLVAHQLNIRNLTSISVIRTLTDEPNSPKITPIIREIGSLATNSQNWLLVEDIVGTGETIKLIYKKFSINSRKIYSVSLIRNIAINKYEKLPLNYYGQQVEKWVQFPWEK